MANFRCNVSVLDGDGDISTFELFTSENDLTAATARFKPVVEAADVLIKGQITEVAIAQVADISTWTLKNAPEAYAENEIKGRFIFTVVGGHRTRISLPTFKKDTYTVVGGSVDTSNADVIAFINTGMINGNMRDSRYVDITALISAYEAFGSR